MNLQIQSKGGLDLITAILVNCDIISLIVLLFCKARIILLNCCVCCSLKMLFFCFLFWQSSVRLWPNPRPTEGTGRERRVSDPMGRHLPSPQSPPGQSQLSIKRCHGSGCHRPSAPSWLTYRWTTETFSTLSLTDEGSLVHRKPKQAFPRIDCCYYNVFLMKLLAVTSFPLTCTSFSKCTKHYKLRGTYFIQGILFCVLEHRDHQIHFFVSFSPKDLTLSSFCLGSWHQSVRW